MDGVELAIFLVLVLPPAGSLLVALLAGRFGKARSRFAAVACLVAAVAAAGCGTVERTLEIGTWFRLEQLPDAVLRLRLDPLAAAVLVPMLLAAAVALRRLDEEASPQRATLVRTAVLLFSAVGLVLSTNLLFILCFWQIAALAGYSLIRPPSPGSVRMLMIHRIPDVLFLAGLLLAWHHFSSLDLDAIRARATAGDVESSYAVAGTIALCLFAAAAARCAQFPLLGWIDDLADAAPGSIALLLSAIVAPAAFYLTCRVVFLLETSLQARLAIAGIGALTVLLAPAVALVETRWKAIVSYCGAALFGWMFVGLTTGSAPGVTGALMLLATHCLAVTALLSGAPRGAHLVAAAAILACGMWGQNRILASLWPTASADAATPLPMSPVLLTLLFPGQALLGFALFRGVFLRRAEAGASAGTPGQLMPALLITAAAGILAVPYVAETWSIRLLRTIGPVPFSLDADHVALLPGLLAGLLGIVAAWMIYSRPSAWPARLAAIIAPVADTAVQRFYLGRLVSPALVRPVLGLARASRFLDRLLLDRLVFTISKDLPGAFSRAAYPLEGRPIQFAALSVLLAAGVLLVVILSLPGR